MSAKQLVYKIEHSLTLPDGRILSAEVLKRVTPGRYHGLMEDCRPDESEYGDYVYKVDGVDINELAFESVINETLLNIDCGTFDWESEITTLVEPE